jgi:hypothetical protein
MSPGGQDEIPPPPERLSTVPTLVWLMLGVVLVAAFIAALVFVFNAPPHWKASTVGPAPAPAPASAAPAPDGVS